MTSSLGSEIERRTAGVLDGNLAVYCEPRANGASLPLPLHPSLRNAGTAHEAFMEADPDRDPKSWESGAAARLQLMLGQSQIGEIATALQRDDVIHLRGLPMDPISPPTPYKGDPDMSLLRLTLANLVGVMAVLGLQAFSYDCENDGRIVRHVCPRLAATGEASSQGWAKELLWHADGAYRAIGDERDAVRSSAPRWLCWAVIHDSPTIPITFVRLVDVLASLDTATVESLLQPQFIVGAPDSFRDRTEARSVPILVRDGKGGFYSRYNQALCRGATAAACASLEVMARALADMRLIHHLPIQTGDIVILDNWRTLHMRPDFQPRWDGRDRWLLRIYGAEDGTSAVRAREHFPYCWR